MAKRSGRRREPVITVRQERRLAALLLDLIEAQIQTANVLAWLANVLHASRPKARRRPRARARLRVVRRAPAAS